MSQRHHSHAPHFPRPAHLPNDAGMPVGAVIMFAGQLGPPVSEGAAPATAAPHVTSAIEAWGWMLCDGRVLKAALYPELFAALGNLYDAASQDGQFQIPDYRGYFLRGADGGSGNDPDADQRTTRAGASSPQVGSSQVDAFRNHEHGFNPTGAPTIEATGPPGDVTTGLALDSKPLPVPVAGISARETRPKNVAVHYLIRFTGWMR